MKKIQWKGFVAGLLTAVFALGLGGMAVAATRGTARTRTLEVTDGISVTVNGVPFTPTASDGTAIPVFASGGVTYVPVRQFSEAAGMTVDYDSKTRTARIETGEYAAATDPQAARYIGVDKARELALADAKVAAGDALFLRAALDWEDGKAVYEVEFCAGNTEYDYELDALTGAVLKRDKDIENFDWSHRDNYHADHDLPASPAPSGAPQKRLTAQEAQSAALGRLPGGQVVKCELDEDDGVWVYELELRAGAAEYDCEVDAVSGEILKWERDD